MRKLTEAERAAIWKEVCADFPDDLTMQEVHFARLVHRAMLRGASVRSRIAFYRQQAAEAFGAHRAEPAAAGRAGTSTAR